MLGNVGQEHSVTPPATKAIHQLKPDGLSALGAGAVHCFWEAPDRPVNQLKGHGRIDDELFTGQGLDESVAELWL